MRVGIQAIYAHGGHTVLNVRELFEGRGLNLERFDNLMMKDKAIGLPCEDPVTHAVNAAKPIIDRLSEEERSRIEMVITASESGLDFGKSMSTYIHDALKLPRSARLFEVKQACYAGTAALSTAVNYIASGVSPGARVLVVATDVAGNVVRGIENYAEPSMGTGAVAMLVSDDPQVLEMDFGANGFYSYEVMDTCRPIVGHELGDADLSLLSYLDCLSGAWKEYSQRVEDADYCKTFDFLSYHTPFAGMVKGAHRRMLRRILKMRPDVIEADFQRRVSPSLKYCQQVGNLYSASVYLALLGTIDQAPPDQPHRVGIFSYGSGCSSEFYSGVLPPQASTRLQSYGLDAAIAARYRLRFDEYESLLDQNARWGFGIRDQEVDLEPFASIYERNLQGRGFLVLKRVKGFHREYDWS